LVYIQKVLGSSPCLVTFTFNRPFRGRGRGPPSRDPGRNPWGPPDPEDPDDPGEPWAPRSDAGTDFGRTVRELRIGKTPSFDGTPKKLTQFLHGCAMYLQITGVYDTDEKKVVYILSFMDTGTALVWKEQFL
jgi:hypothetical protein